MEIGKKTVQLNGELVKKIALMAVHKGSNRKKLIEQAIIEFLKKHEGEDNEIK